MNTALGGAPLARAREGLTDQLRRKSLTWRLVAVLVVLLLSAIMLSNITTSIIMRRYLVERAVQELQTAAAPVASRVLPQYLNRGSVTDLPSSYVVVFMDDEGNQMAGVAPEGVSASQLPTIPPLAIDDPRVGSQEAFTVIPASGHGPAWIAIAGELGNSSGTYAVATSLGGVEETINKTVIASFSIGLIVVGACVGIGWLGVRRAFRPLRTIEDTASAIAAGDLTRRVPPHAAPDEVQSLSNSINVMLTRIEQSFRVREASQQRMRRFVTDASHELRTPLATVKGYAELYRQGAASAPEQTAAAMQRIENEATRMAGLVEDLLTLARLDDERPMTLSTVDLTVLAADAVQDARVRAPEREIRLISAGPNGLGPSDVIGDEARLRQVVTNLVANALSHTPAHSPLEVAVASDGVRARLEVRDHGQGIPSEVTTKVFERFYREDPARGRRQTGGYGLGLAIVAAIVEAHDGRVGVATTAGGGATFVVELPALARSEDDERSEHEPVDVGEAYAAFTSPTSPDTPDFAPVSAHSQDAPKIGASATGSATPTSLAQRPGLLPTLTRRFRPHADEEHDPTPAVESPPEPDHSSGPRRLAKKLLPKRLTPPGGTDA